nr:hypothetical protein [uncultured Devosia sp.]
MAELGGKTHEIRRGHRQALAPLADERGAIAEQALRADAQGIGDISIGLLGAEGHGILVQGGKAQPQRLVPLGHWPGGMALTRWRISGRSLPRRLALSAGRERRVAVLCGHGFSCPGGMPDRRG